MAGKASEEKIQGIQKWCTLKETSSKPGECILRFNSFRKSLKEKKDYEQYICQPTQGCYTKEREILVQTK